MKALNVKLTNDNKAKIADDISDILNGFDTSTITVTNYDECDNTFVSVNNELEQNTIDRLEFVEQYGDWYYGLDIVDNTGNGVFYIWKTTTRSSK